MKIYPNTAERQVITPYGTRGYCHIEYIIGNRVTWTGMVSTLQHAEEMIARRKQILAKRATKPKPKPHVEVNCVEDQVRIFSEIVEWEDKNYIIYRVVYFNTRGFKQWTSFPMSHERAKKLQKKRIKELYKRIAAKQLDIPVNRLRDDIDYENITKH